MSVVRARSNGGYTKEYARTYSALLNTLEASSSSEGQTRKGKISPKVKLPTPSAAPLALTSPIFPHTQQILADILSDRRDDFLQLLKPFQAPFKGKDDASTKALLDKKRSEVKAAVLALSSVGAAHKPCYPPPSLIYFPLACSLVDLSMCNCEKEELQQLLNLSHPARRLLI